MSTADAEMTARPGSRRPVATIVAMHLGFVDAFGFVLLGRFFVSSIDATTTRNRAEDGRCESSVQPAFRIALCLGRRCDFVESASILIEDQPSTRRADPIQALQTFEHDAAQRFVVGSAYEDEDVEVSA